MREREPAIWALRRITPAPTGRPAPGPASSAACGSRITARADPPARAHPSGAEGGSPAADARDPREPLPHLHALPRSGRRPGARSRRTPAGEPWHATDEDRTLNRIWRVTDPGAIAAVVTLRDRELLIADGHHRYETARVYAQEIGGEGEHD